MPDLGLIKQVEQGARDRRGWHAHVSRAARPPLSGEHEALIRKAVELTLAGDPRTFSPRACPVGASRLRSAVAALIAVIACALPAAAQPAVGGGPAPLTLPLHPTEAGKPLIYDPQFAARSGDDKVGNKGCAPGFSCRLRLLGVIQNNGAVELRATAFTW